MKKRIVCFGDSNTWGYNALESSRYGEEIRWTGRLQRLLGEEYTVIEEAQNGRTTVWDDPIENRLAGLTYLWPCMESHSPFDLLIIMLGTNDTKLYFNVPAGFSQAYQEVAGEYGCYFLDAARYAAPCEYDGVHLDEDGHKKLACAVYDKVKNILG